MAVIAVSVVPDVPCLIIRAVTALCKLGWGSIAKPPEPVQDAGRGAML
jgi:hypothetical protein